MPRVAEDELRNIIEAGDDENVIPFIDDAATLVDEVLGTSSGLTESRLKLVEKYLAAHLWVLAMEKGGLTMEKRGEATNTYVNFVRNGGTGLSATRFGRLVQDIDTSGALDKVLSGSTKKAILRVV